jgi:hypothetical protein
LLASDSIKVSSEHKAESAAYGGHHCSSQAPNLLISTRSAFSCLHREVRLAFGCSKSYPICRRTHHFCRTARRQQVRVRHEKVCFTHTFWWLSQTTLDDSSLSNSPSPSLCVADRAPAYHPKPRPELRTRKLKQSDKRMKSLSWLFANKPARSCQRAWALQTTTHKRTRISTKLILKLQFVATATG